MICPSCNAPNRDDAKFCKKCGQPLHIEAAKVPEAAGISQAPVQESGESAEDISTAPTQIISPQQMMAFHTSRWQKDLEQAQSNTQATPTTAATDQATSGATGMSAQSSQLSQMPMPSSTQNEASPDIADIPTVTINPSADNEAIPIPPPPPMVEVVAPAPDAPAMVEAPATSQGDKVPEEGQPVVAG